MQGKMWRVIKRMYESSRSTVLLEGEKSEVFNVEQGVAQGCSLSPIFNPRCACAARVTVLALCVCVSVCLCVCVCVCVSVSSYSRATGTKPAHERYQRL